MVVARLINTSDGAVSFSCMTQQLDPLRSKTYACLGSIHTKMGDLEAAQQAYETARETALEGAHTRIAEEGLSHVQRVQALCAAADDVEGKSAEGRPRICASA